LSTLPVETLQDAAGKGKFTRYRNEIEQMRRFLQSVPKSKNECPMVFLFSIRDSTVATVTLL
jgi:hypothetical protein